MARAECARRVVGLTVCFLAIVLMGAQIALAQYSAEPDKKRLEKPLVDYAVGTSPNEIKIASYNVQNLFDDKHDHGKNDYEFLPLEDPAKVYCDDPTIIIPPRRSRCLSVDWTKDLIKVKLGQIRRVLEGQGNLPELLAVQEIENDKVAKQLADELGYSKFVITNGPDHRGIEVALFFNEGKIRYEGHREFKLKFTKPEFAAKPTRNVLAVYFRLQGISTRITKKMLAVYVNHWPSQAAPGLKRFRVAEQVLAEVKKDQRKYGSYFHAIVTGDFNTTDSDIPHPFHNSLANPGDAKSLLDVHELYFQDSVKKRDLDQMWKYMPRGTYFYGEDFVWNRFDRFFISKNLANDSEVEAVLTSYRIVAPEFATTRFIDRRYSHSHTYASIVYGVPRAYDFKGCTARGAGFSDHFPVVMKVKLW
jgi:hypothetical protein